MNCKPGDLAVIVRSGYGHEGKIVRCIRLYVGHVNFGGRSGFSPSELPAWEIDTRLEKDGEFWPFMADALLRPIRPSEGQDETLAWCSVPNPTKETV